MLASTVPTLSVICIVDLSAVEVNLGFHVSSISIVCEGWRECWNRRARVHWDGSYRRRASMRSRTRQAKRPNVIGVLGPRESGSILMGGMGEGRGDLPSYMAKFKFISPIDRELFSQPGRSAARKATSRIFHTVAAAIGFHASERPFCTTVLRLVGAGADPETASGLDYATLVSAHLESAVLHPDGPLTPSQACSLPANLRHSPPRLVSRLSRPHPPRAPPAHRSRARIPSIERRRDCCDAVGNLR